MIALDWSLTRMAPRPHQTEGVRALLEHPAFALFDDVGGGKSKQVIDAAFFLYQRGDIDAVLILAPGSARSVWADEDPALGEIAKHGWASVPHSIHEYHIKRPILPKPGDLAFVVSNYEFVWRSERLAPLLAWVKTRKVLLVCDESWMVQSHTAKRTKATFALSQASERVVILNGTPGDPGKLYSQFAILDRTILGYKNFFAFRAHFAKMGGWMNKKIVGWERMEEFQGKTAPYVLRRRTRDVFELGDPPTRTQIDVTLTPTTWKHYKQMRDQMILWLQTDEGVAASEAGMAGVKLMRLSQILAGFVGGIEWEDTSVFGTREASKSLEIGSEKLDAVVAMLQQEGVPNKAVLWGRFRREIERAAERLAGVFPSHLTPKLYGGQDAVDRHQTKQLLAPGGDPRPCLMVGSTQAGGAGLHFGAASLAIYLSLDFSLKNRQQSEGRLDRPGQVGHVRFVDVIATGPNGQKTVDHHIAAALRRNEEIAEWTSATWRAKLLSEE